MPRGMLTEIIIIFPRQEQSKPTVMCNCCTIARPYGLVLTALGVCADRQDDPARAEEARCEGRDAAAQAGRGVVDSRDAAARGGTARQTLRGHA